MLNTSDSHKVSGIITQRGFKRLSPRLIQTVEASQKYIFLHKIRAVEFITHHIVWHCMISTSVFSWSPLSSCSHDTTGQRPPCPCLEEAGEAGEAALPHPWFCFFVLIFYWLCFWKQRFRGLWCFEASVGLSVPLLLDCDCLTKDL